MPKVETIWIIGASDGIGAALAREWATHGTRLVLSARSIDRLNDLVAELGEEHVAIALDVADRVSVDAAAKQVAELGPLDRIINLAAIYDPGQISELNSDTAAQIVSINLTGSFHIAQVGPPLLRSGGQMVLCGSVAGYIGLPQGQIYSATKAGVINLAESLRAELAERIDVRLISPGFVDTRMTQQNDFSMPAMVTTEAAAKSILDGLNGTSFEVHFPRRFTWGLKMLSALPYWAALPLTKRFAR